MQAATWKKQWLGHTSMQTNVISLQPAGRHPEANIPQDYMTSTHLLVESSTGYRCPNFFGYEMWLANLAWAGTKAKYHLFMNCERANKPISFRNVEAYHNN
jgi:hypothetical protein